MAERLPMKCTMGHAGEAVDGCFSCNMLLTSDSYRAARAQSLAIPPPAVKVGEPERAAGAGTAQAVGFGPGTEAAKLTKAAGIPYCPACGEFAKKMDHWGVEGCKARLPEIVAHFEFMEREMKWGSWFAAGFKAMINGVPLTPRGLAEEAIRLAEEQEALRPPAAT